MASQEDASSSIISATAYGKNSASMLRRIEMNLLLIIIVIGGLMIFSLLDVTGILKLLQIYSENMHDLVVAIFSIIAVLVMIPLLISVMRSRHRLQIWKDIFEENSLRSSFELSLTGISKHDILGALAESVEEISKSLQQFISRKGTLGIEESKIARDLQFDILIDEEALGSEGSDLETAIADYGSIIVQVVQGSGNIQTVQSFLASVAKYVASTRHHVGLAICIAQDFDGSTSAIARSFAHKFSCTVLLIERPVQTQLR